MTNPKQVNIDVRAPKDGFVTVIPVKSGDTVTIGQALLTFDSMDEDKQQEKIEKMALMRDAHMAQYKGPALSVSIEILRFATQIAKQEQEIAQRNFDFVKTDVEGCGSPKCHPGGKSAVDGPRMPTKALRHVSRSASWHTSTFICLHFFAEYQNTELGGQIIAVMEATELWHG